MNNRERYLNTLLYKPVDRRPLEPGHPRLSTLRRWRTEGLPEGADYFKHIMGLLRIDMEYPEAVDHHVNARMLPIFEEKVLSHENGHYIVQDWMGAITEISDDYDYTYIRNAIDFVTRKWHKFPVETKEDWQEMKKRYDPLDPSRMPQSADNLATVMNGRDYISRFSVNGPFWQLREWMGFENLCVAFIEQPGFVSEMIDFWCDFVLRLFDTAASKIPVDCFFISEDMAFKAHSMISPQMTREFLLPVYKKWVAAAARRGVPLIDMDSDGFIEGLIPVWIEAGINVCNPIEVAAHNDIALFKEKFGDSIAYRGGVDKRAIAAGGLAMESEVRRVTSPFTRSGGLIPGCDHGVPHDISFGNFVAYTKLLAQLTGWL
ncbi:MAG: hypothetical protein FWH01_07685 [Oscillospiraceae bacterium]|nr:hypothetical protein [Oscillospiraceae bacterium]